MTSLRPTPASPCVVVRPIVAASILLSAFFFPAIGHCQNPPPFPSVIPQTAVPTAPLLTYCKRSQQEVQQNRLFTGAASVLVNDSQIIPIDWEVSIETSGGAGRSNNAFFIGESIPMGNIDPTAADFEYHTALEVPAVEPPGVVNQPADISIQESLMNPAVGALPKPTLLSATSTYSYTVQASNHSIARVNILTKFARKMPVPGDGDLKIKLLVYDFQHNKWVEKDADTFDWYQCTVMLLMTFSLDYNAQSDVPFIKVEPHKAYIKWRVELRNAAGNVLYGSKEEDLIIWQELIT